MAVASWMYLVVGGFIGLWIGSTYPKAIKKWFSDMTKLPKRDKTKKDDGWIKI